MINTLLSLLINTTNGTLAATLNLSYAEGGKDCAMVLVAQQVKYVDLVSKYQPA